MAAWSETGKPAKILSITALREMPAEEMDEFSVRIIGKLAQHDFANSEALIVDPVVKSGLEKPVLKVDTRLVEPLPAALLFQFVGEVSYSPESEDLVLQAFAVRDVSSLDVKMFMKAVEERQRYFDARDSH